ncbi:MAG TPA: alpha/beta fold hydrolase, partial [Solirubrobacterales bacterium]|nr:alpha/beta fold hydrolase [Solirubrobacterales bacterium]
YLLGPVPALIVWGERDRTIPIEHGRAARDAIPDCRMVTLPDAAHFPHLEDPDGLAEALERFIAGTRPHRIDEAEWARLIGARTLRRRHLRAA